MAEQLTPEQAAIIGAYTGVLCGPFSDVHAYVERVLGRPVWTHEFGSAGSEIIKAAARDDFLRICVGLLHPVDGARLEVNEDP